MCERERKKKSKEGIFVAARKVARYCARRSETKVMRYTDYSIILHMYSKIQPLVDEL